MFAAVDDNVTGEEFVTCCGAVNEYVGVFCGAGAEEGEAATEWPPPVGALVTSLIVTVTASPGLIRWLQQSFNVTVAPPFERVAAGVMVPVVVSLWIDAFVENEVPAGASNVMVPSSVRPPVELVVND